MSIDAKPIIEPASIAMKRLAVVEPCIRRRDRRGRRDNARHTAEVGEHPANRPLTLKTLRLIAKGAAFSLGSDHFVVADRYASSLGPRADVIILHGSRSGDHDVRCRIRAVQVRDVERLIQAGCIAVPPGTATSGDHLATDRDNEEGTTSTSLEATSDG